MHGGHRLGLLCFRNLLLKMLVGIDNKNFHCLCKNFACGSFRKIVSNLHFTLWKGIEKIQIQMEVLEYMGKRRIGDT